MLKFKKKLPDKKVVVITQLNLTHCYYSEELFFLDDDVILPFSSVPHHPDSLLFFFIRLILQFHKLSQPLHSVIDK